MGRQIVSRLASILALAVAIGASAANAQSSTGQITVLYDAFGETSTMTKGLGVCGRRRIWRQAHPIRHWQ